MFCLGTGSPVARADLSYEGAGDLEHGLQSGPSSDIAGPSVDVCVVQ